MKEKSNNIPIPSWYKPEPPKSWWKRFLMAIMGSLTGFFGVAPIAQAQLPVFLQPLASRVRTLESEEQQATAGTAPTASRIQEDIQKQVALAKEEAAAASEITSIEYEIKIGDSLSKIAQDFYGDMNHWPVIYVMNQGQIKNPNLIYPGQKLIIPLPAAGAKQFSTENIVEATAAAAALQGVKETVTAENAEKIALQISTSSENIPRVSGAAAPKTEVVQAKEASEIIADTAAAIDSTALSIYKAAQAAVQTPGINKEQVKQASIIAYATLTLQTFARQEAQRTPTDEKDELSIVANMVITARMMQAESQKIADLNLSLDPQSPAGTEVKQVSQSLAQKIEEIGKAPVNISPALKAEIDVALAGTAGTGEARESTTATAPHYGSFTEMKEKNPVAYSVFTVISWAVPAVVGIPMQLGKTFTNPIQALEDLGFAVSTLFGAIAGPIVGLFSPSVPPPSLGEVQAQITEDQRNALIDLTRESVMQEEEGVAFQEQLGKEMDKAAEEEEAAALAEFGELGEEEATTEETGTEEAEPEAESEAEPEPEGTDEAERDATQHAQALFDQNYQNYKGDILVGGLPPVTLDASAPVSLEDSAAREQGFATAELAQAFGSAPAQAAPAGPAIGETEVANLADQQAAALAQARGQAEYNAAVAQAQAAAAAVQAEAALQAGYDQALVNAIAQAQASSQNFSPLSNMDTTFGKRSDFGLEPNFFGYSTLSQIEAERGAVQNADKAAAFAQEQQDAENAASAANQSGKGSGVAGGGWDAGTSGEGFGGGGGAPGMGGAPSGPGTGGQEGGGSTDTSGGDTGTGTSGGGTDTSGQ